jgi:hypothetical protein
MEELRSTESLDKEILEDARKKARKILKTADDTIAEGGRNWEKKLADAVAALKKHNERELGQLRNEIAARVVLDKRRVQAETVGALLHDAMEGYLNALPRPALLGLLRRELRERFDACFGTEDWAALQKAPSAPRLAYRALTGAELADTLKTAAGESAAVSWDIREADARFTVPGHLPAMVIDTTELRLTVSIDTLAGTLLLDKRAELLDALLGPEALTGAG